MRCKTYEREGNSTSCCHESTGIVGVLTTDDLTRNLMQVVEEFATMLFIMERRTDYDREMIHRVTR